MKIEINALDTLFFRDGRPFERGDENWATGTFPPMPSVIYGALRTAYLGENPNGIDQAIKTTEALKIKNIFLKTDTIAFPIPLDLVYYKSIENQATANFLKLQKKDFISNNQTDWVLKTDKLSKVEELGSKALLKMGNFIKYLNATSETTTIEFQKLSSFLTLEPKTGIGRNNQTSTTETGLLYRAGMQRLEWCNEDLSKASNQIKFVVEFEDLTLKESGFFKLGGENKVINYKLFGNSTEVPLPNLDKPYFKIYLATPAIFKKDNLPEWLKVGKKNAVEVKLLTCAIGKSILIGGFDMQKKSPKPMFKAVPAGSVYYIQTKSAEEANQVANLLHNQSISEERADEGFGKVYIGKIQQNID